MSEETDDIKDLCAVNANIINKIKGNDTAEEALRSIFSVEDPKKGGGE